jgi:hypothetical protein
MPSCSPAALPGAMGVAVQLYYCVPDTETPGKAGFYLIEMNDSRPGHRAKGGDREGRSRMRWEEVPSGHPGESGGAAIAGAGRAGMRTIPGRRTRSVVKATSKKSIRHVDAGIIALHF